MAEEPVVLLVEIITGDGVATPFAENVVAGPTPCTLDASSQETVGASVPDDGVIVTAVTPDVAFTQ
jgi:hypothetical protein